MEEEPNVL
jgi:hypothetical protein